MIPRFLRLISLVLLAGPAAGEGLTFDFKSALSKASTLNLSMPRGDSDGRVQTLNKKGAMAPDLDAATIEFLAHIDGKDVLEVGAAYGNVALRAAQRPFAHYTLNDLDLRHLVIAAQRLGDSSAEGALQNKVRFCAGSYPEECHFPDAAFDAILAARVLHFSNPVQLAAMVADLYRILKPQGRVYIVAITPYVKRYAAFIPEYERRREAGEAFPGYVKALRPYLDESTATPADLKNMHASEFMFLDSTVLDALFRQSGFKTIRAENVPMCFPSSAWQLDGRENVIFIAEKP